MILSSFGFRRKVDFVLYFCNEIDIFEETHFPILGCLGFIFKGFCPRGPPGLGPRDQAGPGPGSGPGVLGYRVC